MVRKYLFAIATFAAFQATQASATTYLRQVPSGTTDDLTLADLGLGYSPTIAWISTTTGAKTEDLNFNSIACNATYKGYAFTVKDEIGTAGANPITVVALTSPANTIDGAATFTLNSNYESITFQCDGVSNWLVE
jgi:hypothetical protein